MKFVVDYKTGVTMDVEAASLYEVMEMAYDSIAFTQQDVAIKDENGRELVVSKWYGMRADEEDEILVCFGDYGFYGEWIEM